MTDPDRKSADEGCSHPESDIHYNGLQFEYHGYRYDKLADAQAYARLMRSSASVDDPQGPFTACAPRAAPDDAQRSVMASLAIGFEAGTYQYEGFRYARLSDAVDYARLTRRRLGRGFA